MDSFEDNLYLARLCEQTERFDDMIKYMKQLVKQAQRELTMEERNLLSVAYKNNVGSRRSSWRVLQAVKSRDENNKHQDELKKF